MINPLFSLFCPCFSKPEITLTHSEKPHLYQQRVDQIPTTMRLMNSNSGIELKKIDEWDADHQTFTIECDLKDGTDDQKKPKKIGSANITVTTSFQGPGPHVQLESFRTRGGKKYYRDAFSTNALQKNYTALTREVGESEAYEISTKVDRILESIGQRTANLSGQRMNVRTSTPKNGLYTDPERFQSVSIDPMCEPNGPLNARAEAEHQHKMAMMYGPS